MTIEERARILRAAMKLAAAEDEHLWIVHRVARELDQRLADHVSDKELEDWICWVAWSDFLRDTTEEEYPLYKMQWGVDQRAWLLARARAQP